MYHEQSELRFAIDEEFRSYSPRLRLAEAQALEASLRANGCLSPLVVWNGLLLDGHARLEICERVGVDYQVIEVDLANRDEAIAWIETSQMGRRNLTPEWITYCVGMKQERFMRSRGDGREQAIDLYGISERLARHSNVFFNEVNKIAAAAGDEAKQRILLGRSGLTGKQIGDLAKRPVEDIRAAFNPELGRFDLGYIEAGQSPAQTDRGWGAVEAVLLASERLLGVGFDGGTGVALCEVLQAHDVGLARAVGMIEAYRRQIQQVIQGSSDSVVAQAAPDEGNGKTAPVGDRQSGRGSASPDERGGSPVASRCDDEYEAAIRVIVSAAGPQAKQAIASERSGFNRKQILDLARKSAASIRAAFTPEPGLFGLDIQDALNH